MREQGAQEREPGVVACSSPRDTSAGSGGGVVLSVRLAGGVVRCVGWVASCGGSGGIGGMAKSVGPEPGCDVAVAVWLVVPCTGLEAAGEVVRLAGRGLGCGPVVVVWLNVPRVRSGDVGDVPRLGAHSERRCGVTAIPCCQRRAVARWLARGCQDAECTQGEGQGVGVRPVVGHADQW